MKNIVIDVPNNPSMEDRFVENSIQEAKWLLGTVALIFLAVASSGFLAALLSA